MPVADIKSTISLDSSQFQRGISQAQSSASSFASLAGSLKGQLAGMFTVTAIAAFAKAASDLSEKLITVAKLTGVHTDTLQALGAAAEGAGSSQDAINNILVTLQKNQGEALRGSEKLIAKFAELGITLDQLKAMDTEALFVAVSKALVDAGYSGEAFASAMGVAGNELANIQEVIEQVAASMDGLKEANSSAVISPDALKGWADLGDAATSVWQSIKSNTIEFTGSFLGGLKMIRQELKYLAKGMSQAEASKRAYEDVSGTKELEDKKAEQDAKKKAAIDKANADNKAKADAKAAEEKKKAEEKVGQEIDRLLKQQSEQEERNALARMTDTQKVAYYEKQLADSRAKAEQAYKSGDKLTVAQEQAKQAKLVGEIDEANRRAKERDERNKPKPEKEPRLKADQQQITAANELARVGGFMGAQRDASLDKGAEQVRLQRDTNILLQKILAAQKDNKGGVAVAAA